MIDKKRANIFLSPKKVSRNTIESVAVPTKEMHIFIAAIINKIRKRFLYSVLFIKLSTVNVVIIPEDSNQQPTHQGLPESTRKRNEDVVAIAQYRIIKIEYLSGYNSNF